MLTNQNGDDEESHGVSSQFLVDLSHQQRSNHPSCAAEGVEEPQPVARLDVANNLGEDGGTEGETEGVADGSQDKTHHELDHGDPGYVGTPLVSTPGVAVFTNKRVIVAVSLDELWYEN